MKPDFFFLEFSYYYEHPRIQKAKYGSGLMIAKINDLVKPPSYFFSFLSISSFPRSSRASILTSMNALGVAKEGFEVFDLKF